MESGRWDKFRILTISLIFSGALNIGLILALVFSAIEDPKIPIAAPKIGSQTASPGGANRQLLSDLLKLSFSELVVSLTNREPVEEGYAKRDLALSALVSSHCFNLDKALSSSLYPKRVVSLSPGLTVEMYPGLTDEQYEAIIRYAYQEKWPLTPKGLFLMLKKWPKNGRDPSLCEAFFAGPEFYALQVLFQKTGSPQDPHKLLDLVCQGPWEVVEGFAKEQAQALDLSPEKRRVTLLAYLSCRSAAAADLLIQTDFQFAKTRIEDSTLLLLLELLEKSVPAEKFCAELLQAPRSDAVWKAAAEKLYAFSGESAPVPFDLQAALARFGSSPPSKPVPGSAHASTPVATPSHRIREHTVQEGESLWKIARQHKVKVEEIVELNGLEKDRILPGMVLRLP